MRRVRPWTLAETLAGVMRDPEVDFGLRLACTDFLGFLGSEPTLVRPVTRPLESLCRHGPRPAVDPRVGTYGKRSAWNLPVTSDFFRMRFRRRMFLLFTHV